MNTQITQLLLRLDPERGVDGQVTDQLFELLYAHLREMAEHLMRRERVEHTLQPTALLHEAFLKLVTPGAVDWKNRAHFLAVASLAMRQILTDHARGRRRDRRGGGWQRVTLSEALAEDLGTDLELIALDDALERLRALDARVARVAEMRIFAGMEIGEIAQALAISPRTVDGDWATARMWLTRELSDGAQS